MELPAHVKNMFDDGNISKFSTGSPWSTVKTIEWVLVSISLTVWSYDPVNIKSSLDSLVVPQRT